MAGTPTPSQRRKLACQGSSSTPSPACPAESARDLLFAARVPVLMAFAAADRRIGHVNACWRDYCGLGHRGLQPAEAGALGDGEHTDGADRAWDPLQAMPASDRARWMADWAMAAAGGARRHHGHYRLVRARDRQARRHLMQIWRLDDEPQGFAWLVCAEDAEEQLEELDHLRALALRLETWPPPPATTCASRCAR